MRPTIRRHVVNDEVSRIFSVVFLKIIYFLITKNLNSKCELHR